MTRARHQNPVKTQGKRKQTALAVLKRQRKPGSASVMHERTKPKQRHPECKATSDVASKAKSDNAKLKKIIRVFNVEESTHTMPEGLQISQIARVIVNMASAIPGYSIDKFFQELTPLITLSCFYTPEEVAEEFETDLETIAAW